SLYATLLCVFSFFLQGSSDNRDLHSFPTRRSSDLGKGPEPCIFAHGQDARLGVVKEVIGQRGERVRRLVWVQRRDAVLVEAESLDRKSTRLNSSHGSISYAVFCLKKKKKNKQPKST